VRILLVEPTYYTRYPPLGLLKLGKHEERNWNDVELVRGTVEVERTPDKVYITSLFTFAWKPVHDAIGFYRSHFPNAEIHVGGIYATLMPQHLKESFPFARVHLGLVRETENLLPAYHLLKQVDKWRDWKKSILFTSRGCIRKCPFCVVPKVEGGLKEARGSVASLIHPDHNEVVIWDNDFLASPFARQVLVELRDGGYKVDFNQGLDARLMTEEFATILADLKMPTVHMAYDWPWEGPQVHRAIDFMADAGFPSKNIIFYVLHNFYDFKYHKGDTPPDFLKRLQDLMAWGSSAYPMRFIPLNSLTRRGFVSPLWTEEQLEMIADARRVLGHCGTLIHYRALADKFIRSETFADALRLNPVRETQRHSAPLPIRQQEARAWNSDTLDNPSTHETRPDWSRESEHR
jgi:hypothetical protein